jgi:O-antigen/teichoic acid export membrane protein
LNIQNKSNSYWKDIFFQASGNSIAQVIGILGMPFLTRLYLPETFALQAVFVQIVMFLAAFITFRMEYFIPLAADKVESLILSKWVLVVGFYTTITATVMIFLLHITNTFMYFDLTVDDVFYLAPITAYAICMSLVFQHEAQRQGAFKNTAISEVSSKFSYVSTGAILSFFTTSIGLILSTMLGAVGKMLSLRNYVIQFIRNIDSIEIDRKVISKYSGRSKGMVISNTILTVSGLLPILFIGKYYSLNTLGQYSLVMATVFLPSGLIGSAVGNVFYQRAAVYWSEGDVMGLKNLWQETLIKLIVVAIPIYFFIYVISPWAYAFFFGTNWVVAGDIAQVMSLAAFFSFLAGPLDRLSLVLGLSYYLPVIHIIRLSFLVMLIIVAKVFSLNQITFMFTFSLVMSFVYIVDVGMCRIMLNTRVKMK